jgi:NAD(P)-dependent dehydrogenase (short-subunit alcohol dehydrogenase family)
VTGAARGIGQVTAVGLAERGANVVLGDVADLSETTELIANTGGIVLDPSEAQQREGSARGRLCELIANDHQAVRTSTRLAFCWSNSQRLGAGVR